MKSVSHKQWLILLLAGVFLLGAAMLPVSILPADSMPTLIAQDATSTPVPTVEGTPPADATAMAEATPGVDIASSVEDVASEAVSGFEDLTWGECGCELIL